MHFLTGLEPALALAVPFLFSSTHAPLTNFWPLMVAWLCGWVMVVVWWFRSRRVRRQEALQSTVPDRNAEIAALMAGGLLLAALLASTIGLLQYFDAAAGWEPWIHASRPGQAMGNLRQRNQQATLLSMGVWALL